MLTYSRGDWNAVVTPLGVALFADDMPVEGLHEVWHALNADPGPGAVIGGLIGSFGSSLGVLPSFAAAFYDVTAGEVRLMVRGSARARVTDAAGVETEVSGLGVSTWTERAVANPVTVELIGAGQGDVVLPLRDGVVGASEVTWAIAPDALLPTSEHSPRPLSERSETKRGEGTEPVDDTMTPAIDHTHAEPGIEATTGYDDLVFGETRLGTVEDAAVRDTDPPLEVIDPLAPSEQPLVPEPVTLPTRPSLITGIPGGAASAPGDHDGETVSAEHVAALAAQLAAAAPAAQRAPVARRVPTLILSTGERIDLDRSAVIGRKPRAVRATGTIPHLVTVPSPSQDISRTHVELRVDGTDVVATDLGTTNGTWLLRVGIEPVRLQPAEPALLVTGDRIDLGEGVVLSFEGL